MQYLTINDLSQIGSHNQREKKAYKSNPDIRIEDSYKNMNILRIKIKFNNLIYLHKKL